MKSKRITAEQVRNIYLLLGECRELGDDLSQWRSHFWFGLSRLVDADLIMHAAIGANAGAPSMRCGGAWGFENGFNAKGWLAIVQEYGNSLKSEMTEFALRRVQSINEAGLVIDRRMIIPDSDWPSTFDKTVIADTIGTSAVMQSYFWLADSRKELDSMVLTRGIGCKQFGELEVEIVKLLHSEVAKQIGRGLSGYDDPQPKLLPPRVRQVLRCILEGDGDKQIAYRLNISPFTVNQYTKQIYKHCSVSGRTELMSRWIKRGWSIRPDSWNDQPAGLDYV